MAERDCETMDGFREAIGRVFELAIRIKDFDTNTAISMIKNEGIVKNTPGLRAKVENLTEEQQACSLRATTLMTLLTMTLAASLALTTSLAMTPMTTFLTETMTTKSC